MTEEIEYDLFERVRNKLENNGNKTAQRLLQAVEEVYETSGKQGVEDLFLEIRERYVGKN